MGRTWTHTPPTELCQEQAALHCDGGGDWEPTGGDYNLAGGRAAGGAASRTARPGLLAKALRSRTGSPLCSRITHGLHAAFAAALLITRYETRGIETLAQARRQVERLHRLGYRLNLRLRFRNFRRLGQGFPASFVVLCGGFRRIRGVPDTPLLRGMPLAGGASERLQVLAGHLLRLNQG